MIVSDLITLDNKSEVPKYKQIVQSLCFSIENKLLKNGDQIPSINEISKYYNLSRDTVMTAFNELKAKGLISSTPGKGYFVKSTETKRKQNVFLLFDELNAFKEILYNSFITSIKGRASVDIYFHYFNKRIFKNIIKENLNKYSTFVIMPVGFKGISSAVNQITNANIFILDQQNAELDYPGVYQNFSKDIFNALSDGMSLLKKYSKLIMVYPGGKEPKGQITGFTKFCKHYNFKNEIIKKPDERKLQKGDVYIVPKDTDLVYLVKKAKEMNFCFGRDIGLISYNDTPLKEVVANGITTISTDFNAMGKTLANMVLNNINIKIENPSSLIIRNSL
ncbi:MAG: GntR family transcriptional regulator [Bacteroidales bacterium]|nr:GntR family transcriptional regulator [Bacteroidales bacterium]